MGKEEAANHEHGTVPLQAEPQAAAFEMQSAYVDT